MDKQAQRDVFRRLTAALGRTVRPIPATPADLAQIGITVAAADGLSGDGTRRDETEGG